MEENDSPVFECRLKYSLATSYGTERESGSGLARIFSTGVYIAPDSSSVLSIPFADMTVVISADYKIIITIFSGSVLTLYDLGYNYESFLPVFFRLRNAYLISHLLMNEPLKAAGIEAEYEFSGSETGVQKGRCEIRLYETGLVVLPDNLEPIRTPYAEISSVKNADYKVTVKTGSSGVYVFSMLGGKFDYLVSSLNSAISELELRTQMLIKDAAPGADPLTVRAAASLLRDGLAVEKKDIEAVSQDVWAGIEKKLKNCGAAEEYDYLMSLSGTKRVWAGVKRGLMGERTGDYMWFLIPVVGASAGEPGNAIAMESVSSQDESGKATYFFRICGRKEYDGLKDSGELDARVTDIVRQINSCMLAINFRREPVYLSEEKLNQPEYSDYRMAVGRIKYLKLLRSLFIGRVSHRSQEQWKNDVNDLLKFNATSSDDNAKWSKQDQQDA
jgi:hypothetical protein